MSTRPIVHIGYHKTGSTWFQKAFLPNVRGVSLVPRELASTEFLEANALTFDPDAVRRRLAEAAPGRLIMSLEGLSGYLHNGGFMGALSKDIAHRLHQTLPDADIVVFIRCQPDILAASYAQYVHYGGTHSLKSYLFPREHRKSRHFRRDKIPCFDLDHFSYWPLLNLYMRLFGRGRVHVYLYEAFKSDRAAFIDAFCERHELDCSSPLHFHEVHNPSLSPQALSVVRRINLLTAGRVLDKRHLVHIPGAFWLGRGIGRALSRLSRAQVSSLNRLAPESCIRRIEDYYAATNQCLAEELELPLAQYGYPLGDKRLATTGERGAPSERRAVAHVS